VRLELELDEDELPEPELACTGFVVIQIWAANIASDLKASFSEICKEVNYILNHASTFSNKLVSQKSSKGYKALVFNNSL